MPLVVYKLGGSLLELENLRERLDAFWSERPGDETRLIVVGGGKAADLVREWDERFDLGESAAHDLAVASLRLTEALVSRLIPGCVPVRTPSDAAKLSPAGTGIIHTETFLASLECAGVAVPKCWEFTTDSISALIAGHLESSELILCKPIDPPERPTVFSLMQTGGLDGEFDRWSTGIPQLGWVNLRRTSLIHRLSRTGATADK